MLDSPGTPAYPPLRNTWEFPPPEVPTRWKWVAVAAGLLGLVAGGSLLTVLVALGTDDFAGIIDDPDLTDTIATQCELMSATVESIPLAGPPDRQAASIRDQNRAVGLMVDKIRSTNADEIRSDRPAEQWLRDWERLVDARQAYARELRRDPNASLRVPVDADGIEITARMDDVWLGEPACEVPDVLVLPSGDGLSGV